MDLSTTGHPTSEELIAFVDGDDSPQVADHVHGCQTCSKEASDISALQVGLRQTLFRFDCPDPHTLGEYELDVVAPEQRLRIATHAVECEECTLELRSLREFLAMPISMPETIFSHLRRVVATLLKPAPSLGLAGVRGADTELRQYQVRGASVSISAGPESGSLIGLLVLDDADRMHGEARLLPVHGTALVAPLDELGNFEFFDLVPGTYALEIQLPDEIIVVQNLGVD